MDRVGVQSSLVLINKNNNLDKTIFINLFLIFFNKKRLKIILIIQIITLINF